MTPTDTPGWTKLARPEGLTLLARDLSSSSTAATAFYISTVSVRQRQEEEKDRQKRGKKAGLQGGGNKLGMAGACSTAMHVTYTHSLHCITSDICWFRPRQAVEQYESTPTVVMQALQIWHTATEINTLQMSSLQFVNANTEVISAIGFRSCYSLYLL